jgi:preprotein translocase subunit SecE
MDIAEKTTTYFKEAYAELKNVNWPNKKEIKQHTLLVIAISLATAVFLGLIDYFFQFGLDSIIGIIK